MNNFKGLGLNPALMQSLAGMKYETPTPVQAQAIPPALEGRDIMGTAQTGTGKTAAFAIPLVNKLLENPQSTALVLTPTRELGRQVMDIMHQLLGRETGIKTAFLIGGESIGRQFDQLKRKPRLIVGTPGRINDHLDRGTLRLNNTDFLVLDETDRMLDMGFTDQLEAILKFMTGERQTLMFSATMPKNILSMSQKYLTDPVRVSVGSTQSPAANISQEIIRVSEDGKYEELTKQLGQRNGSIIIFAKTKRGTDKLARRLNKDGHGADAIHGDLKQNRRDKVIRDFRKSKFRILVATDVAARGLDIPHIEHVINHDLPQVAEDYIHRIGRTARAGAKGEALCLVTPQDGRQWQAILRLIDPEQAKASGPPRGAKPAGNAGKRRRRPDHARSRNPRSHGSANRAHAV